METKTERPDEWDIELAISQRALARARVRRTALEQYYERIAGADVRPEAALSIFAPVVSEESLEELLVLEEELSDARREHSDRDRRLDLLVSLRSRHRHGGAIDQSNAALPEGPATVGTEL